MTNVRKDEDIAVRELRPCGGRTSIAKIESSGNTVRLADGSTWKISFESYNTTYGSM